MKMAKVGLRLVFSWLIFSWLISPHLWVVAFCPRGASPRALTKTWAGPSVSVGGLYAAPPQEISRRRNLAIIAHPDAGKTTLTEKLLLYGGQLQQAGAVRSRADQRSTTSDWMELEKQRGISITSTVLTFEYNGQKVNLLDTPGHQDFSEDTYRTLAACDNAVCLVDAAKGLEPQTRKLLEVCRLSGLPIFTFCNKMDRPAMSPLELVDQIEGEFGLTVFPVLWPIGDGPDFRGVLDRLTGLVHIFERGDRAGKATDLATVPLDDPGLEAAVGPVLHAKLLEEAELLDDLIEPLDMARVHAGDQTPMFFGNAVIAEHSFSPTVETGLQWEIAWYSWWYSAMINASCFFFLPVVCGAQSN